MTNSKVITKTLHIQNSTIFQSLFGVNDNFLYLIEQSKNVEINPFGEKIKITGNMDNVEDTIDIINKLIILLNKDVHLTSEDIISAIKMQKKGTLDYFADFYNTNLLTTYSGHHIHVKSLSQYHYIKAIKHNDLVFGIGPAGTGKTYLAVAMAVLYLKQQKVEKIILARPAVEAGESLGFLPGDLKEKIDPYLRPVYDALNNILGIEHTNRLVDRGVIEIAPLAYMRGRTLKKSFIILDEAQNSTISQMKMFLTRIGFGSKMVVNGDKSQIDLIHGYKQSGLIDAEGLLQNIPGISFVKFDFLDVIRHPLVSKIVKAYELRNKG